VDTGAQIILIWALNAAYVALPSALITVDLAPLRPTFARVRAARRVTRPTASPALQFWADSLTARSRRASARAVSDECAAPVHCDDETAFA
jgi:hypothetical protein